MSAIQKFQDLMKKLFQFDTADLDFGIYRILNFKREQIKKFIEQELPKKVGQTFSKHKDERLNNINQRFEEIKQKVIQTLGKNVFTPTGDLKKEFKETPVGKDYLIVKAQKEEAEKIDEIKLQVFNDLYNFFSRYYEDGDFVPQYRYSIKNHKYAIPYNGEEIKLYWANNEQYYTKTGLLFRDYTFCSDKSKLWKIIFRTVSAEEELGSNKSTKARFFILDKNNSIEINNKTLIIRFQYRELTEKEVNQYNILGGSNGSKQEKINQKIYEKILDKLEDITLKGYLSKEYKNGKTFLFYQLSRFTAKNSKDYFIHKNLDKFLSEQLDYFIKSEVLSIDTLEQEKFLDKHITRAKVVREMGEDIIAFLCQIENFQKKLWEKKKFVLKTEYVITTDRIPEIFYEEILKNKDQKKDWKELGFEIPKSKEDLKNNKYPVDTKYFDSEFKEKLLEKISEERNIDEFLDGILIKSENWQGLNLLLNKYYEKVQTIYIDPPFNTGHDFLFKDNYQDSSWLTFMYDRLLLGKNFLTNHGSIYLHLDHNAEHYGKLLLDEIFSKENFKAKITWNTGENISGFKSQALNWIRQADFIHFYTKSGNYKFSKIYDSLDKNLDYGWLDILGKDKNNLYIEIWENGKFIKKKVDLKVKAKGTIWNDIYSFQYSEPRITESIAFTSNQKPENLLRRIIQSSSDKRDLILDFFAGSGTTCAVAHKLNRKWIGIEMGDFFYEKYIDQIEVKNEQFDMINDSAILKIVKEKNESKIIKIIKLGLLGRLKIVLFGDKEFYSIHSKQKRQPHLSKDINWGGGGFFKYQILEQYEDTLDNIELSPNETAEKLFKNDYLLKYFLEFESRENTSLLNFEYLKNPFSYKLKVNLESVGEPQEMVVDIPETFNYLIGLKVNKIKSRKNNKNKYLFILGEKGGKDVVIVWREYDNNWNENEFKRDKEFIIQELKDWQPHIVYINGQSVLTPDFGNYNVEIRYIEPEFKTLMIG